MTSVSIGVVGAILLALMPTARADAPAYTNRLAASDDPYLRLHAHNPVDWYPWGPEAFAKAKAEGKPIFLSIGYSTCYWCHIAEKELYSKPAIAALMNKWFVNVKVDREQRPDVDRLYIVATEILTQRGAWPNNLFLTPDGRPFYAGSYFPPEDDGDQPGFPRVLAAVDDLWENHRADKVEPAAAELFAALQRTAAAQRARPVPVIPDAWLQQKASDLLKTVDPVNGGFGSPKAGPKFPQASALGLLLVAARLDQDAAARDAVGKALEAMAIGGIHDQLGGGFHRYATEPTWTIPHFEKMLSDNAQLLALYLDALQQDHVPLDASVARDTAGYLMRDMQAPDGGFYTAQDAAVDGREGADYLWTRDAIEAALGKDAADKFFVVYEIAPMALVAVANGGVLRVRAPIAETLKRAGAADAGAMFATLAPERDKLLAVRNTRKQPATDEKIVVGLNGLAIGALARAGAALGAPEMTAAAVKAATRIWRDAYDETTGVLRHEIINGRSDTDGFVDDYAMLGDGMLDLAAVEKNDVWRTRAAALADAMLARFAAPDGRLDGGAGILPLVLGDNGDSDVPSGTSAALEVLARLGAMPDGARFEAAAARLATAMSGQIAKRPSAWPSAMSALVRHPISATALAAAAPAEPHAATASREPGEPSTADHVHATAKVEADSVIVTLAVDPGYHVNARKPSFDYLVPTQLTLVGLKPSSVDYPSPTHFKSAFAKDGLDVYEGQVPLVAHFEPGALSGVMSIDGKVEVQACDAKTCLPPATLPVSAANTGR